jgi:hypothetical protein
VRADRGIAADVVVAFGPCLWIVVAWLWTIGSLGLSHLRAGRVLGDFSEIVLCAYVGLHRRWAFFVLALVSLGGAGEIVLNVAIRGGALSRDWRTWSSLAWSLVLGLYGAIRWVQTRRRDRG